jgi:hypothetical protein
MARVKLGVLAAASGKIGGIVFSHGRGGPYIRNLSMPTNPSSADQVTVRSIFGNLSTTWATLDPDQRTSWTTYAENTPVTGTFGDPVTLTGQQMFVRCNAARQRAGLAIISDGPTTFGGIILNPVTAVVSIAASEISVTFDEADPWAGEEGGALLVYNSIDKGQGIEFHKNPYLFAGAVLGAVVPPTSPDTSLTSPYVHAITNNVFFRFRAVRADGRISQEVFVGPVGNVA